MSAAWATLEASVQGLPVVHRARAGEGAPVLMVHGIGPGTTGETNFGPLLSVLPPDTPAHLIDLAGFGASTRKPDQPGFDVPLWLDQIGGALDRIGRPCVLVGNSVGGALALKAAARRDDLLGVLAIASAAAPMAPTVELTAFWRAPRSPEDLADAMRPMTAARSEPTAEGVTARWRAFAEDGDYAAWFDAALADPQACLAAAAVTPDEAARITAPTRLIHGREDRACPPAPLAAFVFDHLPQADLSLLGACGHNVIAERTADVLAAVNLLRKKGQA